jgi:hypothetical protein
MSTLPTQIFDSLAGEALGQASGLFFSSLNWWFWLSLAAGGGSVGILALVASFGLPSVFALLTLLCLWRVGYRFVWLVPALITVVLAFIFIGYLLPLTVEYAALTVEYNSTKADHEERCWGTPRTPEMRGTCGRLEDVLTDPIFVTADRRVREQLATFWQSLVGQVGWFQWPILMVAAFWLISWALRSVQKREEEHGRRQEMMAWKLMLQEHQSQQQHHKLIDPPATKTHKD